MIIPQELIPKEHPTKAVFRRYKFPISAVAKYLELSYPYVSSMLSGIIRVTPSNDAKIKKLAAHLESINANQNHQEGAH